MGCFNASLFIFFSISSLGSKRFLIETQKRNRNINIIGRVVLTSHCDRYLENRPLFQRLQKVWNDSSKERPKSKFLRKSPSQWSQWIGGVRRFLRILCHFLFSSTDVPCAFFFRHSIFGTSVSIFYEIEKRFFQAKKRNPIKNLTFYAFYLFYHYKK